MNKKITIGIPAYHAEKHITNAIGSIQVQTIKDMCTVIIASDSPDDDYEYLKNLYPDLDIVVLECDKNTGPGLARQRCIDAAKTPWITFIDADDSFMNPVSLERLYENIEPNVIEVQGPFYQEVKDNPHVKMIPRNDITHPWVFGRLYNVSFLKSNNIEFSSLRAMEDGEFNWKIRMTIENTPLQIKIIEDPIYFWRIGSDHSITRIGIEENDGVPLYNYDLCQVGATAASINAILFCKKSNPFNGSVTRFTVEQMIGHYFSFIETCERKPLFAEQAFFNAKRFYHSCYKLIEKDIKEEIVKTMYTQQMAGRAQDFIGIIPRVTFFDFMHDVAEDDYNGKEEFDEIRSKLPNWVIELDKNSGVLGEEGYINTVDEV